MKKLFVVLSLAVAFIFPISVKAEIQTVKAYATAYCPTGNKTATGTIPKEGRTIAGKREWFVREWGCHAFTVHTFRARG